nr:polymer-forming cytoskeletal protein [Clostridium sp. Cult2]
MEIDSLIGEKIKLIGKVQGEGNLRVDGIIEGDIDYKGDVIIGESGKVEGNIYCYHISIAGNVKGNIKSKGNLTLHSTGKLIGDAEISNLIVDENAFFQGTCNMVEKNIENTNTNIKETGKAK